MRFEYAAASQGCIDEAYEERNHDAYFIQQKNGMIVFGVADGCSPREYAMLAAKAVTEAMQRNDPWSGPVQCLKRTVKDQSLRMKLTLLEMMYDIKEGKVIPASTATVCSIDKQGILRGAYLGDSKIIVLNSNALFSETHRNAKEGSKLEYAVTKNTSEYDVAAFGHRKLRSNLLNGERAIKLAPDTIVIAATDGAYEGVSEQYWKDVAKNKKTISLQEIADTLVLKGMFEDDATAVVVRLRSD